MSVNSVQYVVRGYKLDYEELENLCDEETKVKIISDEEGKVSFIYDDMSGEYVVVGEVLTKSNEYGEFDGVIELSGEGKLTDREIYYRVMEITKGSYPLPPIGTLVFTHFH